MSIVVTDERREELAAALEEIEIRSGKGRAKWMKVRSQQRLAYMSAVCSSSLFRGALYYSQFAGTKSYMALTVLSTAKAILTACPVHPPVAVYVDGLPKSRLRWFGAELRHLSIRTSKVVGIRKEEADALIRLADAACGFVRAALSGHHPEMRLLFEKAKRDGFFREV